MHKYPGNINSHSILTQYFQGCFMQGLSTLLQNLQRFSFHRSSLNSLILSSSIYRALEVIAKETDLIQSSLYNNSLKLSKRNTGVLYYDCTNYFFEIEQEDGLKQYGPSKNTSQTLSYRWDYLWTVMVYPCF